MVSARLWLGPRGAVHIWPLVRSLGGWPGARLWALAPTMGATGLLSRHEALFRRAVCTRPRDEARREGGSERRAGGEQSHQGTSMSTCNTPSS